MTLRLRLMFLFTTFIGGVLFLFGVVTYGVIRIQLTNQIDKRLETTVTGILNTTAIDPQGQLLVLHLPPPSMESNVYIQIWSADGQLVKASSQIEELSEPLDPLGLSDDEPVYRDTLVRDFHLRVLNVPVGVGDRRMGVLQVATSLAVVDETLRDLTIILFIAIFVSMCLVAAFSWFSVGRALRPLSTVTEAALHIHHADDLSRRIPYTGPIESEVGQLVQAFNLTLGRLENLFTSQQRFLADVSHELRTPLTVIKGNVDLMRRMKSFDDESLTSIDQEASRLTRLVGDLLLLAQAESGKFSLNMEAISLDTLLLEVFHEMSVLARGQVDLKLSEIDQIQVVADRDRLKQVLLNLIGNAVQYTPQNGEVVLGLCKVEDQAQLTIRDTGPGIPAEDLPHIFDRFYRAEKSRTRSRSTGFGLGLSIANWIVEHHGGEIEVESKSGRGTIFIIWLPLVLPEPGPSSRAAT